MVKGWDRQENVLTMVCVITFQRTVAVMCFFRLQGCLSLKNVLGAAICKFVDVLLCNYKKKCLHLQS